MRFARLLLALVITGASFVFIFTPWGQDLERLSYDSLFLFRGARSGAKNIVIVAIDEPSFDELDLQWPWPRNIHAQLINTLKQAGASAIGLDLLFAETSIPENDQALADAIVNHGKVVLVSELSYAENEQTGFNLEKLIKPLPIIERSRTELNLGLANIHLDSDGFLRRLSCTQNHMSAFSLKIASVLTGKEYVCDSSQLLINFVGGTRAIQTVSYYQALNPTETLPKDFFKNKIVLVGFAINSKAEIESSAVDHFPVPFSRSYGGVMPGVEIHANALENFLSDGFITEANKDYTLYLGLLLGVLVGTVLFYVRPLYGFVIFISIFVFTLWIYFYLFRHSNIYFSLPSATLPLLLCYMASPLFHYLTANREKAFIKKAFSTYLNPKLVTQLIQSPDKLELGGEEREATVMFADLAGFTTLSETLSPKELISFVNKYLGAFADEILRNDGMVDKYIGDCIMAVWGVPLYDPKHSEKACNAALVMKTKLIELNKESEKDISFRIGIASGQVLAGNVGGGTQFNYTVLGNDVNLASRIESLNKFYGTMILVNERTKKVLPTNLLIREVDVVRVKGQGQAEKLFEIFAENNPEPVLQGFEAFNNAKKIYSEKKWAEAKSAFEKVFEFLPNDGPSKVLIKRCEGYIAKPPTSDWDGVYVMTEK